MTYVLSDLHARYDRYAAMLEKINFSKDDTLYNLGDSIEGANGFPCEPARLISDMMCRRNIINLQGNHELMALPFLRALKKTDLIGGDLIKFFKQQSFYDAPVEFEPWHTSFGEQALCDFAALSKDELLLCLNYIESWGFYADTTICGKRFIMSHAVIDDYETQLYSLPYIGGDEWVFSTEDNYHRRYFPECNNLFYITGHRPTGSIDKAYAGRIYRRNNHIAVDTGTVTGDTTGCLCLETNEEFYAAD